MPDNWEDLPALRWNDDTTPWGQSKWQSDNLNAQMYDNWESEAALTRTARLTLSPDGPNDNWTTSATLTVSVIPYTNVNQYIGLVTWQHRRAKFLAFMEAILKPVVDIQNVAMLMDREFNIDLAIGQQLDIIGEWVGMSRNIHPPIEDVYFAWDSEGVGWDSGLWRGPDDPVTGLVRFPDHAYRSLIRGKIAANMWDGTIPGAYAAWRTAFNGESELKIVDYQNMSMVAVITGIEPDAIYRAILRDGLIPLKPAGVRIEWRMYNPDAVVFYWDTPTTETTGGWDEAEWSGMFK